jgi:hypothetical protein
VPLGRPVQFNRSGLTLVSKKSIRTVDDATLISSANSAQKVQRLRIKSLNNEIEAASNIREVHYSIVILRCFAKP